MAKFQHDVEVHQKQTGVNVTTVKERLGKTALATGVVVATTALATTGANAALEVTDLVTEIQSNSLSMQTVMLAVLGLLALFVGYRMIKRSMS